MPLQGWAHSFYWEFSDTVVAPVVLVRPGYPTWQASVIAPSLFGIVGAWIDTWMERLRWWKAFAPRVHRLPVEQRDVLLRVLTSLESPGYVAARTSVRATATILGFNKPDAWTMLKNQLKDTQGEAENMYRHLEAVRRLRASGSTYTNPTAHLLTELAYHGFTLHPRRR